MTCRGSPDRLCLVVFGPLLQDTYLPQGPFIRVHSWQSLVALSSLGDGKQGLARLKGRAKGRNQQGREEHQEGKERKNGESGKGRERDDGGKNGAGRRQRKGKPGQPREETGQRPRHGRRRLSNEGNSIGSATSL